MSSNPSPPTAHHPASRAALARAHTLRRAGLHLQAIHCLEEAMRSELRHDEVFAGMALALKARSQVHVMDDAGALLTVSLVPAVVRRFNPKVEAYCQLVRGLVHRRRAHRSWKAGSPEPDTLRAAIDCFAQARRAAESGFEQRLACVAELNGLYAQGLDAAIAGRSHERNRGLIVDAVLAEALSRSKAPMEDAAHVAGLTIVADLAIGAALQPRDVAGLSDAPPFRAACRGLFGGDAVSWPKVLMRAATAACVPIEQKARALVLGGRCLIRCIDAAEAPLVRAYLVHLTDCDCALHSAADDGITGRGTRVAGLSEQLAMLRSAMAPAFPGRRIFR